jgi:hypothetical protein
MKIVFVIKDLIVNSMRLIFSYFFLLIFIEVSAQEEKNTESDIFYKEEVQETSNKNALNSQTKTQNNTFENSNFTEFINNNKPIFLTGKSSNPTKNSDYYGNMELCYNSIFDVENYSNELRKTPLREREILYFSRVLKDEIIEAKSKSKTYYLYKNAFNFNQISRNPIELDDNFLVPIKLYFSNFKNHSSIQQSVKCYVKSRLDDYNWKSEFDKEDYINIVTQKILANLKLNLVQDNSSYFKIYEGEFGNYNFENNTYNLDLIELIDISDLFKSDFNSNMYLKGERNYNNYVQNGMEFKCNPTIARQIADLFGSERKLNVKLELIPGSTNSNLCICGDCYENNFLIKSMLLSRDTHFNENSSIRIYF